MPVFARHGLFDLDDHFRALPDARSVWGNRGTLRGVISIRDAGSFASSGFHADMVTAQHQVSHPSRSDGNPKLVIFYFLWNRNLHRRYPLASWLNPGIVIRYRPLVAGSHMSPAQSISWLEVLQ